MLNPANLDETKQNLMNKIKNPEFIKQHSSAIQRYYIKQNNRINMLLKAIIFLNPEQQKPTDIELSSFSLESDSSHSLQSSNKKQKKSILNYFKNPKSFFIALSFWVNIVLFVIKIVASVFSHSLSIIASAIDSTLDILSGSILYLVDLCKKRGTIYTYPQGKSRLEPIGVIVFSVVMAMVSLQLLKTGIEFAIADFSGNPHIIIFNWVSISTISATLLAKIFLFCLGSFVCAHDFSPSVKALTKDHFNDILTNSIGLIAYTLAHFYPKLISFDSFGMIILALVIIYVWVKSAYGQSKKIVGISAPSSFISLLAFLASNSHKDIKEVDKVLAYHFGTRYLVEVDIVLPPEYPLNRAHDIGENLEILIEQLKDVERAFVHLDFETAHKPEHKAFY